jgi:hypothetical protein
MRPLLAAAVTGLAALALASAARGQSFTPPAQQAQAPETAACAAADKAWHDASQSADPAKMRAAAASLPPQCPAWRSAQARVQADQTMGGASEIGAAPPAEPSPGAAPPDSQAAPVTPPVDPMSGVPASHAGDAPPP